MLDWLFGSSGVERIPENLRKAVEDELYEFCYAYNLCEAYGIVASKQARLDAESTFNSMGSSISLLPAHLQSIQSIWPGGAAGIDQLKKLANLMPEWFANYRTWQRLVHDLEDREIRDADKTRYQQLVLQNRAYSAQLDDGLAAAKKQLGRHGINLESIDKRSKEKVMFDLTGQQGVL